MPARYRPCKAIVPSSSLCRTGPWRCIRGPTAGWEETPPRTRNRLKTRQGGSCETFSESPAIPGRSRPGGPGTAGPRRRRFGGGAAIQAGSGVQAAAHHVLQRRPPLLPLRLRAAHDHGGCLASGGRTGGDLGGYPDLRGGNRRRAVQRHQGGPAGHVAASPLREFLLLAGLVQHAEPDRSGAGPPAGANRSGARAPTGLHHQHAHGRRTQRPPLCHRHFRTGCRRRRPPGEQHGLLPSLGQGHPVLLDGGTGRLPRRRHRVRLRLHSLLFQAERDRAPHAPDDRLRAAALGDDSKQGGESNRGGPGLSHRGHESFAGTGRQDLGGGEAGRLPGAPLLRILPAGSQSALRVAGRIGPAGRSRGLPCPAALLHAAREACQPGHAACGHRQLLGQGGGRPDRGSLVSLALPGGGTGAADRHRRPRGRQGTEQALLRLPAHRGCGRPGLRPPAPFAVGGEQPRELARSLPCRRRLPVGPGGAHPAAAESAEPGGRRHPGAEPQRELAGGRVHAAHQPPLRLPVAGSTPSARRCPAPGRTCCRPGWPPAPRAWGEESPSTGWRSWSNTRGPRSISGRPDML